MATERKKVLVSICGGGWGYEMKQLVYLLEDDVSFCYMLIPAIKSPVQRGFPDGPFFNEPRLKAGRYGPLAVPIRILGIVGRTIAFIRRERPQVAIAIATLPGAFFLLTARLMGCDTVCIESITRVQTPSRSLRLCQRLRAARHVFVQWPSMAAASPGARYEGSVL